MGDEGVPLGPLNAKNWVRVGKTDLGCAGRGLGRSRKGENQEQRSGKGPGNIWRG